MKSATEKMMDFLARRPMSELELRQKLSRDYHDDDIEDALAKGRAAGWLSREEDLAESIAAELHRKQKGHGYINQYLEQKGLPPIAEDFDAEVAKACALIAGKTGLTDEKAQRMLFNRGFSEDVITRALARS